MTIVQRGGPGGRILEISAIAKLREVQVSTLSLSRSGYPLIGMVTSRSHPWAWHFVILAPASIVATAIVFDILRTDSPQPATILGYLCDCAAAGQLEDIERLVRDCQIQLPFALQVAAAIREAEAPPKLGAIRKALEASGAPTVEWYHIKIVAALAVRKALWFSGAAPASVAQPEAQRGRGPADVVDLLEGDDDFDFEAMDEAVEAHSRRSSMVTLGAAGAGVWVGAGSTAQRILPVAGEASAWVTKGPVSGGSQSQDVATAPQPASAAPTVSEAVAVTEGSRLRVDCQATLATIPVPKRSLPASFSNDAKRRVL